MVSWLMIAVQLTLAAGVVELMRRRVLPCADGSVSWCTLETIWIPIVVVVPMFFFISRIEDSVRGAGWVAFGGPVICGVFGLAAGLVFGAHKTSSRNEIPLRSILFWSAAGVVFILLCSVHELTMWVGQCALAAIAVILWINTPEIDDKPTASIQRADSAVFVALVLAAGQGTASLFVAPQLAFLSATIMVGGAMAVIILASRQVANETAIHIGSWAATYGVMLGLGVLTLLHFVPEAIRSISSPEVGVSHRIAYGFGAFASEAMILTLLGAAAVGARYLSPLHRRIAGWVIMVGGIALASWRLAGI